MLRARGSGGQVVHELVVNGVFAMDSTETSSERELAALVPLDRLAPRVLVGGLGLGYTAVAVLDDPLFPPAGRIEVVELERCLVDWARAGLTPVLGRVAADPRVSLHVADVAPVLLGSAPVPVGPWDAVLLDVDNGPDFLIHQHNDRLYDDETLRAAYRRLTGGGVLAIWCQGPAPRLLAALQDIGPAREHRYAVRREGRAFTYVIYTLQRPAPAAPPPPDPTPRPR